MVGRSNCAKIAVIELRGRLVSVPDASSCAALRKRRTRHRRRPRNSEQARDVEFYDLAIATGNRTGGSVPSGVTRENAQIHSGRSRWRYRPHKPQAGRRLVEGGRAGACRRWSTKCEPCGVGDSPGRRPGGGSPNATTPGWRWLPISRETPPVTANCRRLMRYADPSASAGRTPHDRLISASLFSRGVANSCWCIRVEKVGSRLLSLRQSLQHNLLRPAEHP